MRYLLVHAGDGEAEELGRRLDRPGGDRVRALADLRPSDLPEVVAFSPDVILAAAAYAGASSLAFLRDIAKFGRLPVIALSMDHLADRRELGWTAAVCDAPYTPDRVRRLAQLLVPSARRWQGDPLVLHCGALELREDERTVVAAGERIPLTYSEFELLDALIRRPGITVTRGELVVSQRVSKASSPRAIDVLIRRIRKKLEHVPGISIETVKGVGYRAVGHASSSAT